ncbi:acylglycerol kinase family protein [Pseudomonas sp. RC10]|uniref:acylglycerol kinase family protein n=1 Tax=Pseudomonas bambusae TaxID=3139142 RepID=UPI0031388AEA
MTIAPITQQDTASNPPQAFVTLNRDNAPSAQRIGVVLNPKGGYVRRHLVEFRHHVAQLTDAHVVEASTPAQISAAIQSFALEPQDLLVVIGGDGSLQAALTALMHLQPMSLPDVLVVPAGTTNMSAIDLGVRQRPLQVLLALHRWRSGTRSAPASRLRNVLKVFDPDSLQTQCGLFFGAGAVVEGVRYFHSRVRTKGIRGALGPSLAFGRMLVSLLWKRSLPFESATTARLHLAQHTLNAKWMVILATTLDTLLLRSTPYWGTEKAPIHFTAIGHRAPELVRSLFHVLRGKTSPVITQNQAYVSHNLNATTIDGLTEYLLDGEIFSTQGPLELSATLPVRFVMF